VEGIHPRTPGYGALPHPDLSQGVCLILWPCTQAETLAGNASVSNFGHSYLSGRGYAAGERWRRAAPYTYGEQRS
jgi:hypothetical protein